MIEERLFAHLPDHELVEENQAFRNEEGLSFEPMPGWKLDSANSGRGMVMADLDGDGDIDIVVNNLRGPARLFENQLCRGGKPVSYTHLDVYKRQSQYCPVTKARRSRSRRTSRRTATLCTRPADSLGAILRQSSGDTV